ncbi:hypothetical protein [Jiangella alkaliphila]|uniref:Uncharacterized protein n=1 Tax=Jiangella alkaliphila TaxID=419479 RepID=A0A1H2IN42_9ACTN|nr:hypothetical protein [Jiangella alkaliphila]SDU45590.1 hypothetical protein SAMN04488563_1870 [Jiangella alkaliphila]
MSGRSGTSRRRLPAILIGGSVIATLVAAAPGHAEEPARSGGSAAASAAAFGTEPDVTSVTLVTGDRVHIDRTADGREGITVDPAPRPGGVVPQFHATSRDGVTQVIPADVAALVPDRLDPALFDVTALAAQDAGDTLPLILDYADDAVRPLNTTPVPGATATLQLASVNAVAVDADPAAFGAAVLTLAGASTDAATLAAQPLAPWRRSGSTPAPRPGWTAVPARSRRRPPGRPASTAPG